MLLTKQRLGLGQACCNLNMNIAFAKILCISKINCHLYFRPLRQWVLVLFQNSPLRVPTMLSFIIYKYQADVANVLL